MGLTREFRERVQARCRDNQKLRRRLLAEAIQSLLSGDGAPGADEGYWRAAVGRAILRDFINATLGFPALAERTGIHVKTLHQMFGPKGNPTAAHLFHVIACLQEFEGVRLRVVG
jgi:hypothetical protein